MGTIIIWGYLYTMLYIPPRYHSTIIAISVPYSGCVTALQSFQYYGYFLHGSGRLFYTYSMHFTFPSLYFLFIELSLNNIALMAQLTVLEKYVPSIIILTYCIPILYTSINIAIGLQKTRAVLVPEH